VFWCQVSAASLKFFLFFHARGQALYESFPPVHRLLPLGIAFLVGAVSVGTIAGLDSVGCFARWNSDVYVADIIPSRDVYDMSVVYKTRSDIKSELVQERLPIRAAASEKIRFCEIKRLSKGFAKTIGG
jgi:hypothetical protein